MALNATDIQEILEIVRMNADRIKTNSALFDIYEGDLLRFVKKALKIELHRQSYEQASPRISPININRRLVNKLSKVYSHPPERYTRNPANEPILEFYSKKMDIDNVFRDCNVFLNLHRYCLLQPYFDPKTMLPRARAIPASRFIAISTDKIDPARPTHIVLFMGQRDGEAEFWIYSEEELVKVLANGQVLQRSTNDLGRLPFTYVNRTKYSVMPAPDEDLMQMSVLIPTLLTDVNYATKFQAFSIIYGIDLQMENMELGPSNIWSFKSDPERDVKPDINVLTPKAAVEDMMDSVESQLTMFLESRNIKWGQGKVESSRSGVALMLQNIDITDDLRDQQVVFQHAEDDFWSLISDLHPMWVSEYEEFKRQIRGDDLDVIVEFPEVKLVNTEDEVLEREVKKLENGLSTRRMSLTRLYPAKTPEEIEMMAADIEAESPPIMVEVANESNIESDIQETDEAAE